MLALSIWVAACKTPGPCAGCKRQLTATGVQKHLQHRSWSKRCAYDVCNGLMQEGMLSVILVVIQT